jgi:hypothetical protein
LAAVTALVACVEAMLALYVARSNKVGALPSISVCISGGTGTPARSVPIDLGKIGSAIRISTDSPVG